MLTGGCNALPVVNCGIIKIYPAIDICEIGRLVACFAALAAHQVYTAGLFRMISLLSMAGFFTINNYNFY